MRMRFGNSIFVPAVMMVLLLAPVLAIGQSAPAAGDIPRLADGKPDFSGVWDKPRVGDVTRDGEGCSFLEGCTQEGAGELPFTPWALEIVNGPLVDYTGYCLPWGYTRAWQTAYPAEIIQTPTRMAILFESNNIFQRVYMGEQHPEDLEHDWLGTSVGRWEGDTLVIDTTGFNGKTYIDTAHHPLSEEGRVIERFTYIDADHVSYEVTWDDPIAYTRPIQNRRTFTRMGPDEKLLEYWCMENNKDLLEGRIPPLVYED